MKTEKLNTFKIDAAFLKLLSPRFIYFTSYHYIFLTYITYYVIVWQLCFYKDTDVYSDDPKVACIDAIRSCWKNSSRTFTKCFRRIILGKLVFVSSYRNK